MPDTFPLPLGPYTLFRELGRGGFATVYLARDEANQRDVAVKVLDPKLAADSEFQKRFKQEFKLAARLDHPNIVKAFDYGEVQGQFYLAMTLVRGFDLRTRIRDTGALSVSQALHFAKQIADALDYAHAQGVIHRDVKSANILLNEDGNALLSDFGLMRAVETSSYMTAYSRSQEFVGTAEYISPEQALGNETTARSDLYSFGVVVYEMLTGQVPFHSDKSVLLLRMHADNPPPNPLDVRNDLPPALVNELLTALAKRPADRPTSAVAFVKVMEVALSNDQGAINEKIMQLMQMRESAVAQAKARLEQLRLQKEESSRAGELATKEAGKLEEIAQGYENVIASMLAEESRSQEEVIKSEEIRRKEEIRLVNARIRLASVERGLSLAGVSNVSSDWLRKDPTLREEVKFYTPPRKIYFLSTIGMVVSLLADGTVRIWDIKRRSWRDLVRVPKWSETSRLLSFPEAAATSIAVSPQSGLLAVGHSDGNVEFWRVKRRSIDIATDISFSVRSENSPKDVSNSNSNIESSPHSIMDLAFSPNERFLGIKQPKTLSVWINDDQKKISSFPESVRHFDWRDKDPLLIVGYNDKLERWDIRDQAFTREKIAIGIRDFLWRVNHVADLIAIVSLNGIYLSDVSILRGVPPENKKSAVPDWLSDLGLDGGELQTPSGQALPFIKHNSGVQSLAFSPEGSVLATGSEDNTIRIWNTRTRSLLREFIAHNGPVTNLEFSLDGMLLLSGSVDSSLRIWALSE